LRRERYDVAVDLQGLVKSAAFARMSGAARVIGFGRAHLRERLAAGFYSEAWEPRDVTHVIDKNLSVLALFGIAERRRRFPIVVPESAACEPVVERVRREGLRGYALVNPGAAWPNKQWPPASFVEMALTLATRHALLPVVLWGPGEQAMASGVVEASNGTAMVAPPTGIGDLLALARGARLMLSGDTGPLHLAAAVGAPVVALFGPTDPARNGPWDAADISLSRYADCVCHYQRQCRRSRACIEDISVEDVRAAVDRRLAISEPHA
jgi:ADP-heptose:LPS heptosyltransferase